MSCADCPGTLYVVDNSSVSKFEPHLRNKKHRENVAARLRRSQPTCTEQMKLEKLTRPFTPTSSSNTFGTRETLTPILPPERKGTPVLPTSKQDFSPVDLVKITALESANAEKEGKIEALEQRLSWLEEELKSQGELLSQILGSQKGGGGTLSQRSEGRAANGVLSRQASRTEAEIPAPPPVKSTLRSVFSIFSSPSN